MAVNGWTLEKVMGMARNARKWQKISGNCDDNDNDDDNDDEDDDDEESNGMALLHY